MDKESLETQLRRANREIKVMEMALLSLGVVAGLDRKDYRVCEHCMRFITIQQDRERHRCGSCYEKEPCHAWRDVHKHSIAYCSHTCEACEMPLCFRCLQQCSECDSTYFYCANCLNTEGVCRWCMVK